VGRITGKAPLLRQRLLQACHQIVDRGHDGLQFRWQGPQGQWMQPTGAAPGNLPVQGAERCETPPHQPDDEQGDQRDQGQAFAEGAPGNQFSHLTPHIPPLGNLDHQAVIRIRQIEYAPGIGPQADRAIPGTQGRVGTIRRRRCGIGQQTFATPHLEIELAFIGMAVLISLKGQRPNQGKRRRFRNLIDQEVVDDARVLRQMGVEDFFGFVVGVAVTPRGFEQRQSHDRHQQPYQQLQANTPHAGKRSIR
jgi:hypothetical protein